MKSVYCSIITSNYLPFAKTLYKNLKSYHPSFSFSILIVDGYSGNDSLEFKAYNAKNIKTAYPEDFEQIIKYKEDIGSTFRWALKPLFLKFLLQKAGFDKVIYIDPDIYFYNNPAFLFDSLEKNDILITPHWRSRDPIEDKPNFELLFSGGIFNAGFFGCNQKAIEILDWWLKLCSYKMEKNNGLYVDQAYINLMPVYFPTQVKVVDHKGCNVAGWNLIECERTLRDGEVFIDKEYPVIFVHFTPGTIGAILSGKDPLLIPYLSKYEEKISEFIPDFSFLNSRKKAKKEAKFFDLFRNKKL